MVQRCREWKREATLSQIKCKHGLSCTYAHILILRNYNRTKPFNVPLRLLRARTRAKYSERQNGATLSSKQTGTEAGRGGEGSIVL